MKKNYYFFTITFYFLLLLITLTPLLLNLFFNLFNNIEFIKYIIFLFKFKYNLTVIILLSVSIVTFIVIDNLLINKKQLIKNIENINLLFDGKISFLRIFYLCLLSSIVEEVLFRGYLLYFLFFLFDINIFSISYFFIIFLVSIIFALFHINQGILSFILSFLISIIFITTIIISNTIWYSIIAHFIFNFIQLIYFFPKFKKIV